MRGYTNRIQDKRKECSIKEAGATTMAEGLRTMREAESIYKSGVFGAGSKIK